MTVMGYPTRLLVVWDPPVDPNGIILFYTVYCYEPLFGSGDGSGNDMSLLPSDTSSNISISAIVPGSSLEATVMGLIPFTVYECYVTASTSIGEGYSSNTFPARTDEFSKPVHLQL